MLPLKTWHMQRPFYYDIKYFVGFLSLVLIPFYQLAGQETFDDYNSLAIELQSKYEDEDIVGLQRTKTITLDVTDKSMAYASITTKDKVLSLSNEAEYQAYILYDHNYSIVQDRFSHHSAFGKKPKQSSYYGYGSFGIDAAAPSDGIFHTDRRVRYYEVDLNGIGQAEMIKYATEYYSDIRYLSSVYFADVVPFEQMEYVFKVSDVYDLELHLINEEGYDISLSKSDSAEYKIYTYTINDAPKLDADHGFPGPSYVYPHIIIQIKSYEIDGLVWPLHNSLDDLYDWYASLVADMENEPAKLQERVLDEINAGVEGDLTKCKNILYWVQDNIRYIAYEDGIAGFQPADCQLVYYNKYGDCKGMANLTKQLLLLEGIDARLTWVGTTRLNYDYSIPTIAVDNHMICTAFINGETYYLDATSKNTAFGSTPFHIQGRNVLIEDGEDYILKTVPVADGENNKVLRSMQLNLKEGDLLSGSGSITASGSEKSSLLGYINNNESYSTEEMLEHFIGYKSEDISVNNINFEDLRDKDKPLKVGFDIELVNRVVSFDDEIYLDFDIHKDFAQAEIDQDTTKDYHFGSSVFEMYEYNYEIPDDYVVAAMPAPIDVIKESFEIQLTFEQVGNIINYKKSIRVPTGKVKANEIDVWNEMVVTLNETYDNQIVLKKN